MMASFSTGIVRKNNAKLSSLDKEFILNVLSGMQAGEQWVRTQFRNYTKYANLSTAIKLTWAT